LTGQATTIKNYSKYRTHQVAIKKWEQIQTGNILALWLQKGPGASTKTKLLDHFMSLEGLSGTVVCHLGKQKKLPLTVVTI